MLRLRIARAAITVVAAAALGTVQGAQSEQGLARAEALLSRGQFISALELLDSGDASGADPRRDYLAGFALLSLHRYSEAEQRLRQAVRLRPGEDSWMHALAKCLIEQGRNKEALDWIRKAVALRPDPDYSYAAAMCALNLGELQAAEEALKRCLAGAPGHSLALYRFGALKVDRGDYAGGLRLLEDSLKANPNNLEARYLAGLAETRLERDEPAARDFRLVLEQVPGHVGALYNLGRLLMRSGQRDEGRQVLERFRRMSALEDEIQFHLQAVKKNPRQPEGREVLATKLLEAGRSGEAYAELQVLLRNWPGRSPAFRLLAELYRRAGRPEEAQRADEQARFLERPK